MRIRFNFGAVLVAGALAISQFAVAQAPTPIQLKTDEGNEERSTGKMLADQMKESGGLISVDQIAPASNPLSPVNQVQLRGSNVQVNDPTFDYIQIFNLFRPFVHYTQSETSVASRGRTIVATYNNSAGAHYVQVAPGALQADRFQFSGYSVSTDGGSTWKSDFFPPAAGASFTYGDPSVDVDRTGNFYFAQLGEDPNDPAGTTVMVNRSSNGVNWSSAVIIDSDPGNDKEWLAIGPDPAKKNRDNIYVSWTRFVDPSGSQLWFAKSTDGGQTWTKQAIFTPSADPNPYQGQDTIQFSNVTVDQKTGDIYIPFLHFSNADADLVRMLVSHDGGNTFSLATFNVPGAPDTYSLPAVQVGTISDCGTSGGFRLVVSIGNPTVGRFGYPRFAQATRMVLQPSAAARNGSVYIAYHASTSASYGDPNGGGNIYLVRSDDGGKTWTAPVVVNTPGDFRHFHPSLTIDDDNVSVHVAYYTQHTDGSIDVDMANSHDRGNTFPASRTTRLTSTSMTLPPSNVTLANGNTSNYDRNVVPCYALGEYMNIRSVNGSVNASWGDSRNTFTEPVNSLSPLSGVTHSQEDVFFQQVKAQ